MWPNLQFSGDLVTFTEEIVHGKLHSLRSLVNMVASTTNDSKGRAGSRLSCHNNLGPK